MYSQLSYMTYSMTPCMGVCVQTSRKKGSDMFNKWCYNNVTHCCVPLCVCTLYLIHYNVYNVCIVCVCTVCSVCVCTAATPPCSSSLLRGAIKQRISFCEQLMRFSPRRRRLIGWDCGLGEVKGIGWSSALWEMMTSCTRRPVGFYNRSLQACLSLQKTSVL